MIMWSKRAATRLGNSRYLGVLVGLAGLIAFLTLSQPTFFTLANWQEVARSQAIAWVLALGSTFVILTVGIDLSIASQVAMAGMVFGLTMREGYPVWLSIVLTVLAGLGMGWLNGVLIGFANISFFVVTLATMSIFQSAALLTTEGQTITLFAREEFTWVSETVNGSVGPIPRTFLLVVILYGLGTFVLKSTRYGRMVYAVGSNPDAARLAGIPTRLVFMSVYAISGLTCGIAALIGVGRLSAASPVADPGLTLSVVAAVLIGGVAFTGGDGSLFGTFLGVLFLGLIRNGISLIGISSFWQGLVSGLILLIAVGLGVLRDHQWVRRLSLRSRRRQARDESMATLPAGKD